MGVMMLDSMKKIILLIAVITLISIGQNKAQRTVNIGLYVDPAIEFAITPNLDKNKGIGGGIGYGLMVDWDISDRFALNTGLGGSYRTFRVENKSLYALKSTYYDSDIAIAMLPNSISKYKLQYLELPINLKLKTNDINNYNIYALVGITNRFNLGARANIKPGGNKDAAFDAKVKKDVFFYDVPFNVGAGIHWFLKDNLRAVAGIEYSHGLIDITKSDNSRVTLSEIKLRLGVLF